MITSLNCNPYYNLFLTSDFIHTWLLWQLIYRPQHDVAGVCLGLKWRTCIPHDLMENVNSSDCLKNLLHFYCQSNDLGCRCACFSCRVCPGEFIPTWGSVGGDLAGKKGGRDWWEEGEEGEVGLWGCKEVCGGWGRGLVSASSSCLFSCIAFSKL